MTTLPLSEAEPTRAAAELVAAHEDDGAWLDQFAEAFDRQRSARQLERVLSTWGLSQAEAARMFGVSRQAVGKWLARGVPGERVAVVADLAAATDVLRHRLKGERIPAVVRRPAPALGGRSLVDLAASGHSDEALRACREMLDVAGVHA